MSQPQSDVAAAIRAIEQICARSTSGTRLYKYGSTGYKDSVRHFLNSSTDVALVGVQPGSEKDLSEIIKAIAENRAPFAVKGGGHSMVPGFSSTTGIQIAMSQFNKTSYNKNEETLDIGAGCLWDEVYRAADEERRRIVGGATSEGVGVAGYLLGGGYSLKTNQFGLGCDNITKIRIILTDGKIVECSPRDQNYRDLFYGLLGGGNNFGIVTQFTIKTYPLSELNQLYALHYNDMLSGKAQEAIVKFVTDKTKFTPEANIFCSFTQQLVGGNTTSLLTVYCIYDGVRYVDNPFKDFLFYGAQDSPLVGQGSLDPSRNLSPKEFNSIASRIHDISLKHEIASTTAIQAGTQRSQAASLVAPEGLTLKPMSGVGETNARGRFGCIMVSRYTARLVKAVADESKKAASTLKSKNGKLIFMDIWPFLPTIFDNSPPEAAWPHKKGEVYGPIVTYFLWENEKDDDHWLGVLTETLERLRQVALKERVTKDDVPYYWNTSLEPEHITVEQIYRGNLDRLKKLRAKYDPDDVMGLTGGFRIPIS